MSLDKTVIMQKIAAAEKNLTELRMMFYSEHTTDVHACVLKLADDATPKFQEEWKKVVENGLVENVTRILDNCYDGFYDSYDDEFKKVTGESESPEWDEFVLAVMTQLYKNGSFNDVYNGKPCINDFDDTAGGCDEVVWNVACNIIDNALKA